MMPAFDVVVVADFQPPVARRFEILTLFFLASWLEFAGRSRSLPLHIAGIGEAPQTVRTLAERCGAEITEHAPLLVGAFANKLRGFEVSRKTDHILLLDADILVLSEIHPLVGVLGGDCISAAATNGPGPFRTKRWRKIYKALDLPFPEHQVTPLNIELDTFKRASYRRRRDCPPYYNGGIVFSPWAAGLGQTWRDHLERLVELAPYVKASNQKISNQPSLATAIHALRLQGHAFRLLPAAYHARWQHISTGAVPSERVRLLHTIGFARRTSDAHEDPAERSVETFRFNTLEMTKKLRSHRGPLARRAHRLTMHTQLKDFSRVHAKMRLLYQKYVRELCR